MAEAKKPAAKKKTVAKPKTQKKEVAKPTNAISKELRAELVDSNIITRGRIFVGEVTNAKANKTVRVSWSRKHYIPKYERFENRRTSVQAHNPKVLSVKVGDRVRISECRPISKTKKFVVIEKLEVTQ